MIFVEELAMFEGDGKEKEMFDGDGKEKRRCLLKMEKIGSRGSDRMDTAERSGDAVQLLVRFDRNDYPVLKLQTTESCFN